MRGGGDGTCLAQNYPPTLLLLRCFPPLQIMYFVKSCCNGGRYVRGGEGGGGGGVDAQELLLTTHCTVLHCKMSEKSFFRNNFLKLFLFQCRLVCHTPHMH